MIVYYQIGTVFCGRESHGGRCYFEKYESSFCRFLLRGVAQFGRAPRSGRGGRKFESCHLDYIKRKFDLQFLDIPIFSSEAMPKPVSELSYPF